MDAWLQLLDEHGAARREDSAGEGAGHAPLYALTDHRLLTLVGAGAAALLQGQLTCDINALDGVNACLAAHCNAKGRMLASFLVSTIAGGFVLRVPAEHLSAAAAGLAKYAPFYKVAVVASDWVGLAAEQLPAADGARFVSPYSKLTEYWLPIAAATPLLAGRKVAPAAAYRALELAAGLAEVTSHTSERYTPHDWHYPELGGVSFHKGCYTGQEIIARMHYRGRGKVALYRGRGASLAAGAEFELAGVTCQVVAGAAEQVLIAAAAPLPTGRVTTPAGEVELLGRALPG